MNTDIKLCNLNHVGVLLLFFLMPLQSLMAQQTDIPTKNISIIENNEDVKASENVDRNRLATEAIINTESKFEAILFDQVSQITIGYLYWDHLDSTGTIIFEYDGKKEQATMHASDYHAINKTERYSVLLRGLHEAGVAWFSNLKGASESGLSENVQSHESSIMAAQPRGFIDSITPKTLSNAFSGWPSTGITRYTNGWAFDPDRSGQSSWVHFYGTTREISHKYIGAVLANKSRPDVNSAFGISGLHGWREQVPEGWDADGYRDTIPGVCRNSSLPHVEYDCWVNFYAYGIDLTGDDPKQLANSPYSITTVKYSR
jgi:hypothetical protein